MLFMEKNNKLQPNVGYVFSWKMIIMPLLSIAIIVLQQINHIYIPEIVIVGMFALSFVVLGKSEILGTISFIFCFEQWLPFYLILLCACVAIIFKQKLNLHMEQCCIYAMIYIFISVFPIIFEDLELSIYIKDSIYFLVLLLVFIIISQNKNLEIQTVAVWYLIGVITTCCLSLIIVSNNLDLMKSITTYRFGYDSLKYYLPSNVIIANENNLARWTALATAISLLLTSRGLLNKMLCIPICLFLGAIALITQSRSGMGVLLLTYMLFYLLSSRDNVNNFIKYTVVAVAVVVFSYILAINLFPDVVGNFIKRFDTDDLTNGRTTIFIKYHEAWISNLRWLLVGAGKQNIGERLEIGTSFHNSLQAVFVSNGLLGGGFYMITIFSYMKYVNRNKALIQYWIPFIICFIAKLSGSMDTAELLLMISFATLGDLENHTISDEEKVHGRLKNKEY